MSEVEALEDYARKIQSLGGADAIALHLQGKGIRAKRGCHVQCAIAIDAKAFLHERGFDVEYVSVGRWLIVGHGMADTPVDARDFIKRFDNGVYPELIL